MESREADNGGPAEATGEVSDTGFTLELNGITITGEASIAPKGTPVRAQLVSVALPAEIAEFASSQGSGVEVTLGDNAQPLTPLTITFSSSEASKWTSTPDASGDLVPVVFTSKEQGEGMEFADAHAQPDGSVVVTADHLSLFQPALASIRRFSDWLGDQVLISMQVRADKPDCVERTSDDGDWTFATIPQQLVWPCVSVSSGAVTIDVQNNSPEIWLLESNHANAGYPNPGSITGSIFVSVAGRFIDLSSTTPLMPPGGTARYEATNPGDDIVISATLSNSLTVTNAIISGASIVLPSKKVQALSKADCFLDIVSWSISDDDDFEDPKLGSLGGTVVRCLGTVMTGLAGTLISSVAAIPGAATALIDVAAREMTGRDQFAITLTKRVEPTAVPPTAASLATPTAAPTDTASWPTDRNDGPPTLFVWLGANGFGFPDWVACDDARSYCLLGYPGEEHAVIRMSGLEVVGGVQDSAGDPRQALLDLGLPERVVTEILGE